MNPRRMSTRRVEPILNFNGSLGKTLPPIPRTRSLLTPRLTKRARFAIFGCTAAVACIVSLSGCGHEKPVATATDPEKTLQAPIPEGARDDPRVAGSDSTSDAIAASLAVIHQRLNNLQSAYRDKAHIEGDLIEVAKKMLPMIDAARVHCDAIMRAAKDLKFQLPIAQSGYASAASSYRQRAEGNRDQTLKTIYINFANQFDVLAADTPRRLELTDKFLAQLDDAQSFLAETGRCLRDAETAFAILSGGGKAPKVPPELKAFTRRLDDFIAVVLEYEEKLLDKPVPKTESTTVNDAKMTARQSITMAQAMVIAEPTTSTKAQESAESPEYSEIEETLLSVHPIGSTDAREELASTASHSDGLLPVGARYTGMLTTPAYNFDCPVSLEIIERSGNTFRGIVSYGRNPTIGRRGVRGTLTSNLQSLSFSVEWYEGSLSPDPIRYDLKPETDRFSGNWSSQSLAGTIYFESILPNPKW